MWDALTRKPALVYLNYPSNPTAAAAPNGVFGEAVALADWTDRHRSARLRVRRSCLRRARAAQLSCRAWCARGRVELFSLSKSYGMAGWRLGFVLGNEELVARVTWLQEHVRAGIFVALQRAAIAALTGPQETVAERRALYEARRDRVVAALPRALTRVAREPFRPARPPRRVVLRAPAPGGAGRARARRGFGARGLGRARLSFAVSDEILDAGLDRLRQALARE